MAGGLSQITPFVPFFRDMALRQAGGSARPKPIRDTLPARRARARVDQDTGQREFHVADEDCTLVFYGEPI